MLITSFRNEVFFAVFVLFLQLNYEICLKMKKIVFVAIAVVALCLGGCKDKTITTQYTIGCLGYQYNPEDENNNWENIQSYFKSQVDYNKIVEFESTSVSENDAQAIKYFDEQMAKIDTAYVCGMISGSDYFIYGIATLYASGAYRFVKAIKFQRDGIVEVSE